MVLYAGHCIDTVGVTLKNGRIRRGFRSVLGAISMPERLAQQRRSHQKPGERGFMNALAAEPPHSEGEATEETTKSKSGKLPEEMVQIVVVALQAEGHNGDKGCIKQFEEECGEEIKEILDDDDPVVCAALLKAAAERFAMDQRPRAGNSYKRRGVFPLG